MFSLQVKSDFQLVQILARFKRQLDLNTLARIALSDMTKIISDPKSSRDETLTAIKELWKLSTIPALGKVGSPDAQQHHSPPPPPPRP